MTLLQQGNDRKIKESIAHELDWASNVNGEEIVIAVTDDADIALVRNARVDPQGIQVSVRWNTVRLTGSASLLAKRTQSEDAAWFAPGVACVDNDLTIIL